MTKRKLQWHPGFCAALRIAMQDQMEYLEMQEEHLLSKKPLQMDVLIIKKVRDIAIQNRIGRMFRTYNIIEYKSPDDYLRMQPLPAKTAPAFERYPGDKCGISERRDILSEGRSDPHAAFDHTGTGRD